MIKKRLSALLSNINIIESQGPLDSHITGLAYDSRDVTEGTLFFALSGLHTDGHRFIEEALSRGAKAVIHSKPLTQYHRDITYIRTANPRTDMAPVAAAFYDHPSRELTVIGVTGTDGKSTTVYLVQQLLEKSGLSAGFISTVQVQTGKEAEKNKLRQSTPEAVDIQRILRTMADNGKQYAVIEATSHGLSAKNNRLGDIFFNTAVFTNISHEHLEFHGSFEQYRYDKAELFRSLDRSYSGTSTPGPDAGSMRGGPLGVVNADDPHASYFREATSAPVFGFSLKDQTADLFADDIETLPDRSSFRVTAGSIQIKTTAPLPGAVNIENSLAALLAVIKTTGMQPAEVAPLLSSCLPPPGRMRSIRRGQPFTVIIDYAHTPGSFSKLLPEIKKNCRRKLIVLFGSAGERDREKRTIQGSIACRWADTIILADEDPRGEPPRAILEEIAAGCSLKTEGENLFLIPDRSKAIEKAFSCAETDDTVLLLGKGHEQSIIYSDTVLPWDEASAAEAALSKLGFTSEC